MLICSYLLQQKVFASGPRLYAKYLNSKTSFKISGIISFLTLNISTARNWKISWCTATELFLPNSSSKAALLSLHKSLEAFSRNVFTRVSTPAGYLILGSQRGEGCYSSKVIIKYIKKTLEYFELVSLIKQ